MNQHTAPVGTLATIGHPANNCRIIKTGLGHWRYVDSDKIVNGEDFRAGWQINGFDRLAEAITILVVENLGDLDEWEQEIVDAFNALPGVEPINPQEVWTHDDTPDA